MKLIMAGGDCANQNFTGNFIGCPFDYVKSVAGFPMLFGKWNFVNESSSAVSNVSRDDIDNMSKHWSIRHNNLW